MWLYLTIPARNSVYDSEKCILTDEMYEDLDIMVLSPLQAVFEPRSDWITQLQVPVENYLDIRALYDGYAKVTLGNKLSNALTLFSFG